MDNNMPPEGEHEVREDGVIEVNGTNDMICAICHTSGEEKGAVGICKVCRFYLCHVCVEQHRKADDSKNHQVAFFYCETNMRVNRLVRANSFCLDCGHYLCEKCKLEHKGFREYRHHSFIGGKASPWGEPFEHRKTRSPASRRKARSRMSRSTERKSPYLSGAVPVVESKPPPKKRTVSVDDQIYKAPRTLIQTSVGCQSDKSRLKTPDKAKKSDSKPKRVHYEEDKVDHEARLVGEFSIKGPTDQHKCQVISSTFLGNDNLVVADIGNKNIKLYDSNFKYRTAMEIAAFPVALCLSKASESKFFASSGGSIFLIDANKLLTLVRTITTDIQKIEGLAPWQHGIAVIFKSLNSTSDKKGHLEVHLMTEEGTVKFEVTISSQFCVKKVTPIWYVTTSPDGEDLLLSDTNLNRIICVDTATWHVKYVLRGKTEGSAPRSLTVDADGNVLVTWYNEIHKISKHGKDLGVPVSKADKESIIVYSQKSRQLVVHSWTKINQEKFRVYQLE